MASLAIITLAVGFLTIAAGCARWQAVTECTALGMTGYSSGAGNRCVDAKLDSKQQELVSAIGEEACERVQKLNAGDPSPLEHLCASARVQAENSAWRELASSGSNAPNLTLDHLIPGFDSEFRQSTQSPPVAQSQPSESTSASTASTQADPAHALPASAQQDATMIAEQGLSCVDIGHLMRTVAYGRDHGVSSDSAHRASAKEPLAVILTIRLGPL